MCRHLHLRVMDVLFVAECSVQRNNNNIQHLYSAL